MTERVVVLGSGYAGTGALKSLEAGQNGDIDLTWVSDVDYHLVLHESHRCISDPGVCEKVVIPAEEIKRPTTSPLWNVVSGRLISSAGMTTFSQTPGSLIHRWDSWRTRW